MANALDEFMKSKKEFMQALVTALAEVHGEVELEFDDFRIKVGNVESIITGSVKLSGLAGRKTSKTR